MAEKPRRLDAIRERAKEHADELESLRWWKASQLANRWGVAVSTVHGIDRTDLPYKAFGKKKLRRYHPDDVAAFEASDRVPQKQSLTA